MELTASVTGDNENYDKTYRVKSPLLRGILVGLVIGGILCLVYAGSIAAYLRLSYPPLKVVVDQWSNVSINGVSYGFEYSREPLSFAPNHGQILISQEGQFKGRLIAQEGVSVCDPFRITITEVKPDYVILLSEILRWG